MEKRINNLSDFSVKKIAIFLIFFTPIFLVLGPLITKIVIFFIISLFFYEIYKKKNINFFKEYYFHYFFLLWIYLVFLSLISDFQFFSLKSSFFFVRLGLFYLSICYFFSNVDEIIKQKKIIYVLFFFVLLILFDFFFQKIFNFNIICFVATKNRISSFFGDELILGGYVSRLLPTIFGICYFFKNKKIIKLLPVIWIISIIVVIFSGEKAAFALILISTVFIIFFYFKTLKIKVLSFVFILFIIFSAFYFVPDLQSRIIKNYITNSASGQYLYSRPHQEHFSTAFHMFLSKPVVGYGPRNFRKVCLYPEFNKNFLSCSTHPHNIYLQLLSETGIVVFTSVLYIFLFSCYKIISLYFYIIPLLSS